MRTAWLIVAALLTGCSILPEAEALRVYQLPHGTATTSAPQAPDGPVLRINRPHATPLLDSTRIVVLPEPDQLSAYHGVRWSDRGSVLLRDRLVEDLGRSGHFRAVVSDDLPGQASLEMSGDLKAFQVEYRGGRPLAAIRMQATLLIGGSREVIASRAFVVERSMNGSSVEAAVEALGRGASALAEDLIRWLVEVSAISDRTARTARGLSGVQPVQE